MTEKNNPQLIRLQDYQVPHFLIETVDLDFNLAEDYTKVKSHLTFRTNPDSKQVLSDLMLMGDELQLESISLNGKPLSEDQYVATSNSLLVKNVPEAFTLDIETRLKPQENTALSGLYKSSGNFCTQCEAEGFRRITYFLDRPDVMARYTTTITADEDQYPILLSNGNRVAEGKLPNNKHWVRWEDPFKKPSYLFALVAGNLEFIEDYFITRSGRRITLQIFVEKNNRNKCDHAMQAVKKAMRWDEETYGREYDLDIYMIVAVSDFNMGAMENKGLNIFNTKYILAKADTATDDDFIHVESVIAHEYFHNWSGNRVTCRDWFQLSLKEGLTIFRDQSFTADTTSKTVARIQDVNALRTQQFSEDAGPLAHPVRPDSYIEINNFYTSTIYNKGAEVIRMMKTILGEKLFRQGMDLYFERNDGKAATIEDFAAAMEDASGIDLSQLRLWYDQAGTPVLTVTDSYDANKKVYTLTIKQNCSATPGQSHKKPFHIPVKIGLLDNRGKTIPISNSLLHVKNAVDVFQFENIYSHPIPSLLREFSAPVKVNYDYSDNALQLLFQHDPDEFNRWEAGQKYAVNLLMRLINAFQQAKKMELPVDYIMAFKQILKTQQKDKWLLAHLLMLPSEQYLAEQMPVIDVDAIHAAREYMLLTIAENAKELLLETYQKNHETSQIFSMEEVGKRQLKNLCLSYLVLLQGDTAHDMAIRQFKTSLSTNMTDTMAALRALTNMDYRERQFALEEFYDKWKDDALVLDKWFSLQATSKLPDTLETVKKLMSHEAFDIKNPNKVYALIGAFSHHNPVYFHAINGKGYVFLSNVVQKLDNINPQIAARMVQPLIAWRRYDKKRQLLMREQLELILKSSTLSNDVYELVSKSLNEKIEESV